MSVLAAFAVPHPPIILPEVGRGEERKIQKTIDAYRAAMRRAAEFHPETIVLTSPHTVMYADYFHISPGDAGGRGFRAVRGAAGPSESGIRHGIRRDAYKIVRRAENPGRDVRRTETGPSTTRR